MFEKPEEGNTMKKMLIVSFGLGLVFSLSTLAGASLITEIEPNDPISSAQNIDGAFSLGGDGLGTEANITGLGVIPWVSIQGNGNNISTEDGPYGAYTVDYFSFTVDAGATATFDIDFTYQIDSWLNLYTDTGTYLTYNDDSNWDPGSSTTLDSYLTYNFTSAGTYIIGVGNFYGGYALSPDQEYTLQVTVEGHSTDAAPVPEPATMLLFGAGLTGLAALKRRSIKKS
jgi:hypothetical protein